MYELQCLCKLQYVGRASRPLLVRVREHIINIKIGMKEHSVSKHFREFHNRNPKGLKFWAVEKVSHHWRGATL